MDDLPREPQLQLDPAAVRRAARTGGFLLTLLVLLVVVRASLTPYTEYVWLSQDVRHPELFDIAYGTRGTVFACAFIPTWALFYFSLRQAFTLSLVYLRRPDSAGSLLVSNGMLWIQQQGGTLVRFVSPVLAFLFALNLGDEWNTYLLSTHAQSFGSVDPTFGLDLGFFVFKLPWYRAVANYGFGVLLLTTGLTVGLYVGLQALAMLAKVELARPQIRLHVSLLAAATFIAFGVVNLLKVYEAGFSDSGQFTGAGYADMQGVGALRIFAYLCFAAGIAAVAGWRVGKPNQVISSCLAGLAIFYVLGLGAYPAIVQRFVVDPNRLSREAPFAEKAIQMTRLAYDLNKIDVKETGVHQTPTVAEVQQAKPTLDNMRLWDPEIVRQSFEGLQGIRTYYKFNDVDVDRYTLNGKQTMLMLAARDVNIDGLSEAAQNWTNQRLVYTHGYGIAAVQVNAATEDGQPDFLAKGIPQTTPAALAIDQPRIYFSDFRSEGGAPTDEYAIVHTGEPELDYQTDLSTVTHSWEGDRGIEIGGLVARLMYAASLGDANILFSPKITGQSRLLMHRNVLERASRVFPFLKFDTDPYLVVLNGKLIWILDGYTHTGQIPYSAMLQDQDGGLNYIRNSVKVTVDAYTGVVNGYAVDPNDPILKAYREIYGSLVQDASRVPAGLAAHFRYPEDLFSLQSQQLTQYHVTDPTVFLSNGDAWQIPQERGLDGQSSEIRPYFVEMQLPDEPQPGFLLIRPFTPNQKPNMSGWLAARSDPGEYGKLTLYRFVNQSPVAGPQLMETNFNTTPAVSNINRQYQNQQSDILVGNLLVMPIGDSVMYVEPLYLRSRTKDITGVPRLFRVVLALNDRVVVGDNYQDALNQLFGASELAAGAPPTSASNTGPSEPSSAGTTRGGNVVSQARQALGLLNSADQALRNGDFAKYGELQKQARKILEAITGGQPQQ